MKSFGIEPYDQRISDVKITYGELEKAIVSLGFTTKKLIKEERLVLLSDGKHPPVALAKRPANEFVPNAILSAITFQITWNGITKHRDDLAKIVEQIRKQEQKIAIPA